MFKKILTLFFSIFTCHLAGIVGALFTISAIPNWYQYLEKPAFSVPNWIFGPVWLTLYTLMGISLYLIWSSKNEKKILAIKIFALQLFLNAIWSIIFFGLKSPLIAFIAILALWVLILLTIKLFYKISKLAAFLLTPYLLWVSFAAILNLLIYLLNK